MPRAWSWREVEDVDFSEWILVLKEYVPAGAPVVLPEGVRRSPPYDVGHAELVYIAGGKVSLEPFDGGIEAIQIVGGRGWDCGKMDHIEPAGRGRPPLPRWSATDDLYPVLEFAAHGLAWAMRRSNEGASAIGRRLGCHEDIPACAKRDPGGTVPDILGAFREWVGAPTLKKYRSMLKLTEGRAAELHGYQRLMEWKARFFLQRCPPDWLPPDKCDPPCPSRNAHHATRGHL
jgi:hypothetical protein